MTITAAIVLFAVIWFMVLFVTLPVRLRTQGDVGEIVPGTPASAPADFKPRRTAKIVTLWAVAIWIVLGSVIQWGPYSITDLNGLNKLTMIPAPGDKDE
ncbi:MAG: DUF1467 family protein [Pseudomonadota bacterium]|jgi:predicted secreted protein|nr:DUF1467 family protein [Pseudomonadota bacterium]MEC8796820.1 DUF1467 family protein [Pseudomonadota bacterium]